MPRVTWNANLMGMTSGSLPPVNPKNEAEYARKLALAILSTLETKGFLSKVDVDTILAVAHRAAMQADQAQGTTGAATSSAEHTQAEDTQTEAKPAADDSVAGHPVASAGATDAPSSQKQAGETPKTVLTAPIEVKRPLGPAVLGTRWVKPESGSVPVRSETADLTHEAGAVKVVGQAVPEASALKRPLAPAILTAGKSTAAPEELPIPGVPDSTVESAVSRPDGSVTADPETDRANDSAERPGSQQNPDLGGRDGTNLEPKKTGLPVVIDFEMD